MFIIELLKSRKRGKAREQSGFTLIEAVIGIALLSIVAIAVLMGMSTAFKADALADRQSTAMSLAQSQIESIQLESYHVAPANSEATYNKVAETLNFTIWSRDRAGAIVNSVVGVPWLSSEVELGQTPQPGAPEPNDNGLQRIELIIKQGNNIALTIDAYKVQ